MASASNPQPLFNVFVYGSLLADDVVRTLLKRVPPSSPALLHNFYSDSPKMLPHPCRIIQKYTIFGGSNTHPSTFLKSPSNIGHRFSIKGCVYPAILPVENKKVNGKVLSGITIPELDILDKFEDVEYERKTVDVSLTDGSNTLMVEAYIWADQSDPNLYGEWDFEEWERLHKQSFLKMTMEFLEELEQPDKSGST